MQLQTWLSTKGVHITDLARSLGVSRTMVYRYFSGSVPRRDVLKRIMDLTGGEVTPLDFYAVPVAAPADGIVPPPHPLPGLRCGLARSDPPSRAQALFGDCPSSPGSLSQPDAA